MSSMSYILFCFIHKVYFQAEDSPDKSISTVTTIPGIISSSDDGKFYQNGLNTNTRIVAPSGSRLAVFFYFIRNIDLLVVYFYRLFQDHY